MASWVSAGMPDVGRLQEKAVRLRCRRTVTTVSRYCSQGSSRVCTRLWENGVWPGDPVSLGLAASRLGSGEKPQLPENKKRHTFGIMREGQGTCPAVRLSVETGVPVIQYRETDWEFCRHMAAGQGRYCAAILPAREIRLWADWEKGGFGFFPTDRHSVCVMRDLLPYEKALGREKNFYTTGQSQGKIMR